MGIEIGSTVTWHEEPLGRRVTRRILKPRHLKPDRITKDMASNAPIARALIGREVGDQVTVDTPAGIKTLTVMEVS